MKIENIVFIQYNGSNRPFQVWTDKKEMYDFSMKEGYLHAEWAGSSPTYIHNYSNSKFKKPLKLWFKEEFRPSNGGICGFEPLSNEQIKSFGFEIIDNPAYLEEIINAI